MMLPLMARGVGSIEEFNGSAGSHNSFELTGNEFVEGCAVQNGGIA